MAVTFPDDGGFAFGAHQVASSERKFLSFA